MIPIKIESAWRGASDCLSCGIRDLVLFAELTQEDFDHIHAPIDDLLYKRDHSVFFEGAEAKFLYTVRKGRLKLIKSTTDGHARIVGIVRPGDVIGLEALVSQRYETEAVTLGLVSLCRIPHTLIRELAEKNTSLHAKLMARWHRALSDSANMLSGMNYGTARQRVINLIKTLRDPSDQTMTTLISRQDMGSLTDLKLETVSRVVASLVREGYLTPVDRVGRQYEITKTLD
jgi:CRP-like cAMP-binding protein